MSMKWDEGRVMGRKSYLLRKSYWVGYCGGGG